MASGIGEIEGPVGHIAVPVETLWIACLENDTVRLREARQRGIIPACPIVKQVHALVNPLTSVGIVRR